MKIGIISPPWVPVPPPFYGGTEAVIDGLARGLDTAGHDVLLFTTGDATCPVPRGYALEKAEPDRIGSASVELHHLAEAYRAMERWGADVVHDHTLIGPAYSANHPGLRVLSTNHGPFDEDVSEVYRAIGARVPVIAISADQARRAPHGVVATVIHHGLELDRFPFGAGAGDDHGPYLVFLGRMAPEKGAEEAARVARATGRRLLIAAKLREPAERRYFSERVQPLLGDGIEYVGELAHHEKVRLLAGATALLNPIRWPEPFGLVMIESLACGTPVLTYPEGAAPEIVDDGATGFLCTDVTELSQRVSVAGVLDRTACRAAVERRFTTDRMVDEHIRVYERLLSTAAAA